MDRLRIRDALSHPVFRCAIYILAGAVFGLAVVAVETIVMIKLLGYLEWLLLFAGNS